MKKIFASIVILAALSGAAWATIVLTTPITVPNVQRWKVRSFAVVDNDSYAGPTCMTTVEFIGSGLSYGVFNVLASDDEASDTLALNTANPQYMDRILVAKEVVAGACSALSLAWESVPRTGAWRTERRRAVETAMLATGLVKASLAGAPSESLK